VSRGRIYLSLREKHSELCLFLVRRFFQFNVLKPDDLVWVFWVCAYVIIKGFLLDFERADQREGVIFWRTLVEIWLCLGNKRRVFDTCSSQN
jgi:hypothetical protein